MSLPAPCLWRAPGAPGGVQAARPPDDRQMGWKDPSMRPEPRLVHSGSFLGGPAQSAGLGGRLAVDLDGCIYAEVGACHGDSL